MKIRRRFLMFFVFFGVLVALPVDCPWAYEIKDNRDVSTKKPVNISAFQLLFDRLKGLTLFKGKVKAVHDQVTLTSNELRALSDNREATAEGQVKVVDPSTAMTLTCGNLEYQDMMNLMTAHDHPLLTSLDENGRPITVQGRQMELDSEKKTIIIHQNVQISHDDGKAEAQKATFLSKEDKFILEEDPSMTVPNGKLSGRKIVSNMGVDRSIVVEGMADAVFNSSGAPVTGKSDHAHLSGKSDQSPTSPGGHQGGSSKETNDLTATPTPGTRVAPGGVRL